MCIIMKNVVSMDTNKTYKIIENIVAYHQIQNNLLMYTLIYSCVISNALQNSSFISLDHYLTYILLHK